VREMGSPVSSAASKVHQRLGRRRRFAFLFTAFFVIPSALLIVVSVLLHRSAAEERFGVIIQQEDHAAEMRQDALAAVIESAVSDLIFLRELNELSIFLNSGPDSIRLALERELQAFSETREAYDQIRVMSPSGHELLRINQEEDSSAIVPVSELQSKGDRYYFQEMLRCATHAIYVSQLDLNVEDGVIELPIKPILRLAARLPIADSADGHLMLNLLGENLLRAFEVAHPGTISSAYLLDPNGYWLRGPTRDDEWGFALHESRGRGFHTRFPNEWKRIEHEQRGQFETTNGYFTFETVSPYGSAEIARCALEGFAPGDETTLEPYTTYHWKNVSWIPPSRVRAIRASGAGQLAGWNFIGVLCFAAGSWFVSKWLTDRRSRHEQAVAERALFESTLQKYMPSPVYNRLITDPSTHAKLGGESQTVAVLFADIRGFTGFAEKQDPQYVVSVLNRTMTELTTPLHVFDGILDKYIGDGFLAFFEASAGLEDAAQRAVSAAEMMQKAFRNLWADASNDQLRALGLGIGISVGRVVVGNIGTVDSMDYTIVGDAVNVASRLQGLANHGESLISERTHALLTGDVRADLMQGTKLRGRDQSLDVYRISTDKSDN